MRRIAVLILITLVALCTYLITMAQSQPLILLINGDLWSMASLESEPFRETYWGYNNDMSLSPNGQYVAYGSFPDWLVERDLAGVEPINIDTHPPTNIWVMEVATRTFTRIATQDTPPINDFFGAIRRTQPIWSPDSRQLAWLELPADREGSLYLTVYDLQNETFTRGPNNLPGVDGDAGFFGITSSLSWRGTLAFSAIENFDSTVGATLTVLNTNEVITNRILADFNRNEIFNVKDWRWVEHDGQWYIALRYVYGWQLWDYVTNTIFDIDSEPTLQIASGEGLHLSYNSDTRQWTIIEADGTQTTLPDFMTSVALSPDGNSLAYVRWEYGDPNINAYFELWQDGETSPLIDIETFGTGNRVLWESMVWRVDGILRPLPELTPIPTATQAG